MRKYQVVEGVIAGEDAQAFELDQESLVVGGVQNWLALIQAKESTDKEVLNRVSGSKLKDTSNRNILKSKINNVDCFNAATTSETIRLDADFDLNPNEFSIFAVCSPVVRDQAGASNIIAGASSITTGTTLACGFSADASQFAVNRRGGAYWSGAPRLMYTPVKSFLNRNTLIMVTFSVDGGLKIFENGVLVAENKDDKTPLDFEFKSGEFSFLRGFQGKSDSIGVINSDLSKVIYQSDKQALDKFFIEKYSVAV